LIYFFGNEKEKEKWKGIEKSPIHENMT